MIDDDPDAGKPKDGQTATFEQLGAFSRARPSTETPTGQPAIGCIKADADRLGLLVGHGFAEYVSFGRVATLSRQLDLFFQTHLTAQFSDRQSPYRHVYTIFAAGEISENFLPGKTGKLKRLAGTLCHRTASVP